MNCCKKICCKIENFLRFLGCNCIASLLEKKCCQKGGSGSGSNPNKLINFKLIREPKDAIGRMFHRSGWDKILKALEVVQHKNGILFDDFVEQNFCYNENPTIYKEDWVGIFHHPHDIPYFGNHNEKLQTLLKSKEFIESSKHLKLAIALTDRLADYLRTVLDCKVVSIKHPTFFDFKEWDLQKYKDNPDKKLAQVGFYLRNSQLINQIPCTNHDKIRLVSNLKWTKLYDKTVKSYWKVIGARKEYGNYKDVNTLTPSRYDKLLTENVVCVEYFALSASNTILDCIARNTPIIVNKTDAAIEYLGKDYPLYFSHPYEIPSLLDKVEEAHIYLKNMDKSDLTINYFINQILIAINE